MSSKVTSSFLSNTDGFNYDVGVSKNSLASNGDAESGEDGSGDEKSYEVSKTINKKQNPDYILPAIIFMVILGIIVGYGFIRNKN